MIVLDSLIVVAMVYGPTYIFDVGFTDYALKLGSPEVNLRLIKHLEMTPLEYRNRFEIVRYVLPSESAIEQWFRIYDICSAREGGLEAFLGATSVCNSPAIYPFAMALRPKTAFTVSCWVYNTKHATLNYELFAGLALLVSPDQTRAAILHGLSRSLHTPMCILKLIGFLYSYDKVDVVKIEALGLVLFSAQAHHFVQARLCDILFNSKSIEVDYQALILLSFVDKRAITQDTRRAVLMKSGSPDEQVRRLVAEFQR